MYIDGVLEVFNDNFVNNTYVSGKDLSFGVDVSPAGFAPYTDSHVGYFSGAIDDIRIYNRALSEEEIEKLYDSDGDGISDYEDNCPNTPNGSDLGTCTSVSDTPELPCTSNGDCASCGPGSPGFCSMNQENSDGDAIGDACDNCVNDSNPSQLNNDGDVDGNACDDDDGDGIDDAEDNCSNVANPSQDDTDTNGIGDACDCDSTSTITTTIPPE